MRTDPPGSRLDQRIREPRVVIALMFDVGSIYLTTERSGQIINIPGSVVHGCVEEAASVSHELHPDEGRATIGSFSFVATDLSGALTDLIRDQLFDEGAGVRHHEVRLFTGDTGDFDDDTWRRVATYIIDNVVEYDQGSYRFSCVDRQREMRKDIFSLAKTRLTATLETNAITMSVADTDGFEMLQHTASFTDAPLATVGYLLVKKTGEIIRYTAKSASPPFTFSGLTREINSIATRIEVNPTDDNDRRPEIEEFPYLEMAAPQAAYALLTGTILGTSITLPESWHLGIAAADVDSASFSNIGTDLFDPNNFDSGLILRFIHLDKTDGKAFIEKELLAPIGCFLAITPEGKLQLRRMVAVLEDAATVRILTDDDIISHSALGHDQAALINEADLHWNYDGDGYTRTEHYINATSISTYGTASVRELEYRGLVPTRTQPELVRGVFNRLTARYGAPPLRLACQLSSIHNDLEVGDTVKVVLDNVRDYAGLTTLNRAFEVQQISVNWITGEVEAQLFGSAARIEPDQPDETSSALNDSWYTSTGTNLSSILTIVGGHVTTNGGITGGADLRTSVFYFGGNLTIDAGVTVNLIGNVQLRILGALTINGTLQGPGNGIAATADPNTVNNPFIGPPASPVYTVGITRGSAGVEYSSPDAAHFSTSGTGYVGLEALPDFALGVDNGVLTGIPSDLRGTQGLWGMPVLEYNGSSLTVRALGGAGGPSGAGLMLVLRGALAFGVSGTINLSGGAGSTGGSATVGGRLLQSGGGGGGAPGCLLVALDRRDLPYPDLVNKFTATHGATTQGGNPITRAPPDNPPEPWTGYDPGISTASHFGACHKIQYVPLAQQLGEGNTEIVPVPTIVNSIGTDYGIEITIESIPEAEYDVVEVWGSIDNNRANATKLATGRGTLLRVPFENLTTYYVWLRSRQGARRSEWNTAANAGTLVAGGSATPTTALWEENFDGYATQADFEHVWQIVEGVPTITFPTVGVNGARALEVTGFMRAIYRKQIAYDVDAIYALESRFRRTVADAGDEGFGIGAFGVTAAGEVINGQGNVSTAIPANHFTGTRNLGDFTLNSWKRIYAWLTGSFTSLPTTSLGPGFTPWSPSAMRNKTDGNVIRAIRPSIECNKPAGTGTCQVDYLKIGTMAASEQAEDSVIDTNFSGDNDDRYWYNASGAPQASLEVGGGLNGGNALRYIINGTVPGNFAYFGTRHAIRLSNTLDFYLRYKITGVTSIGSVVDLSIALQGIRKSSEAEWKRSYFEISGSLPEAEVNVNTLTADGGVYALTLSFSNLMSNSYLADADFVIPLVGIQGPESSDNFTLRVVRIRAVRG